MAISLKKGRQFFKKHPSVLSVNDISESPATPLWDCLRCRVITFSSCVNNVDNFRTKFLLFISLFLINSTNSTEGSNSTMTWGSRPALRSVCERVWVRVRFGESEVFSSPTRPRALSSNEVWLSSSGAVWMAVRLKVYVLKASAHPIWPPQKGLLSA